MLLNLLRAPSDVLGYAAPDLNLSGMYSPVRLLGQGHNSTVYEAIANAEHFAIKVGLSHFVCVICQQTIIRYYTLLAFDGIMT